jgi:hypothetical protein
MRESRLSGSMETGGEESRQSLRWTKFAGIGRRLHRRKKQK